MIRVFDIVPVAAPRQGRRDAWAPSAPVRRYRAYRDEVALKIKSLPVDFYHVVFLLPMPKSWSKHRKALEVGRPHLLKPDKDNLEKALVDAVYRNRDDSHVWNSAATKLWAPEGRILISDEFIRFETLPVDLDELLR